MNTLLAHQTCLITGASRGIGKGIAELFAKYGCNIAFTYRHSVDSALELEHALQQFGIKAKGYQSDCSRFEEAENVVNQVVNDFGGLNILINNAGITKDGLLLRMTEAQWDEVLNTNLKSVFALTKAAQKPMLKAKHGSIINISSFVGVRGNAGQSNYAASKAGIIGFTKSIAQELGSRNIRCNAIAPGFIATEMTGALNAEMTQQWIEQIPLKRSGTVNDVAQACLFLASDLSSYITGQCLSVCGGMLT
ncbi:MAG: 3-oxoacyl-[acyl-carrier-protein] reductase [Bacteroidota bacterium]|jgi:3-oxoacyl-[acyl-carrier protein] reductase|nr:3-oxoacyl-[acyl-carrier-protein] reductase [Bacteroidia bacterium]NBY10132.1 3-oxoacyl-[acyl-carrier-protein] reductase [Sphingobacteriia bacterium]